MNDAPWMNDAARLACGIRKRVLEHTLLHNGGYLSQACSAAEILSALYLGVMRLGPNCGPLTPGAFQGVPSARKPGSSGKQYNGPGGPDDDRFFLSPSQYALVLYAALVELGRMSPDGLGQFNQDGGIVEMIGAEHSPGMEVMSGSLGQGLSQALGIALARKLKGEQGRVWVFMSDGEFQCGQTWEAVQSMSFHRIHNIGVYVDVNGQQCDGRVDSVMNIEPLHEKLKAFGAEVRRVDGHDLAALYEASQVEHPDRPLFVLCDTDPCRGIDILKANSPKLHYVHFKGDEERAKYQQLLERMA